MLKDIGDGIWSVALKVLTILPKISILMKEKKKSSFNIIRQLLHDMVYKYV